MDPDRVTVAASAASSQSERPGTSCGLNRGDCPENPTIDIFVYRRRIVLHVSREMTSVCVLLLGITRGLVRLSVFVSVILSEELVAFRRDQYVPPS